MKRILPTSVALTIVACAHAFAADIPARVASRAPAMVPVYNWTGWYVGLNAGYSWSNRDVDGAVGGGQLGYNWQNGQWVFGVETDVQASGQRGSVTSTGAGITINETEKLTWFGTTRVRAGWAMDRFLPYLTGGVAYGTIKHEGTASGAAVGPYSTSTTKAGWAVGAGLDGAITSTCSWRLEYLFLSFPGFTNTYTTTTPATVVSYSRFDDHVVRAALNYRFAP